MNPSAHRLIIRYFEKERFVGEEERWDTQLWQNVAFFCPLCGQLWGRKIYDYFPAYVTSYPWRVEGRRCASCGDGQFLPDNALLLGKMSKDLLTRELLALFERK